MNSTTAAAAGAVALAAVALLHRRFAATFFWSCSAADVAQFKADGYLVVKGLLSQEENALVRRALETDATLIENKVVLNDDDGGSTSLALWSNPGDGTLGMLSRATRIVYAMRRFLGGAVLHYHSKSLLKPPNQGGVWNWHQDYGYWYKDYFLHPRMVTVYVAIDPQNGHTLKNGALRLLKGSHHIGRVDHWSKGDQQGADLERVEQARGLCEEITVDLEAGDAIFFHCLTMHSSSGNDSSHRRLALASCYTRADNVQWKDAYIPCYPVSIVSDRALMESADRDTGEPTLTSAEEKCMMSPDVGVERARKDNQNS